MDSVIAFCEDSQAIREYASDFPTSATVNYYSIPDKTYETVARFMTVKVDGVEIEPATTDIGPLLTPIQNSKPTVYYTRRTDSVLQLMVYPTPDAAYTLSVECAWKPFRNASVVQDDIYNIWVETIVNGALGRLMMTPGQPFSNPAEGERRLMLAKNGANRARIESIAGRTRTSRGVRPRPFA